jgi:glycogen synthase
MEGFGLPPVEAMACGTPVISSTAGSLPEVVGDAGIFFDPTDVAAIAGALRQVFDDPAGRDELARTAFRRSSRFTWSGSARALLATFGEFDPGWDPRHAESILRLDHRSARSHRREARARVEAKLPVPDR